MNIPSADFQVYYSMKMNPPPTQQSFLARKSRTVR